MTTLQSYLAERGATARLAKALGITHAAVRQWGTQVPSERVVEVERVTGIPREALRPDLYVREPAPASEQTAQ